MLLQQLNGAPPMASGGPTPVTDPMLLQQLNAAGAAPPTTEPAANWPLKQEPAATNEHWLANAFGQGALPLGLAPRVQALAAATKESLSSDPYAMPFGDAYGKALKTYQGAAEQQKAEHPIAAPAAEMAGSVLPLYMGSEAINAGLRTLGPAGRFLAGEADIPGVARAAGGRFRALSPVEEAVNYGKDFTSKLAMLAREGAQSGAFGAAQEGTDPLTGAGRGALFGTVAGAAIPPLTWAAGKLGDLPGAVGGMLPSWAKVGLSAAGGAGALEHAGKIAEMATEHSFLAMGAGAGAVTIAASKFLTDHPEFRDLLTRMGVMSYGPATGGSSSVVPGPLSPNR